MTADAVPLLGRRIEARDARPLAAAALAVAAVVLYLVFRGQWRLPHDDDTALFRSLNEARDWIGDVRRTVPWVATVLDGIRALAASLTDALMDLLVAVGWPAVVAATTAIGWAVGGWRIALLGLSGLVVVGALGLWEPAMQTLGLTLAAVLLSLAIGIPVGIVAGKRDRVQAALAPVLDALQIMPQFAYLVPFVILFGIGPGPAALVTMLYAVPATIRITALGIRGVPPVTLEAARSLGTTGAQILRKVELPLARQTIGLAVNQTIMLALSMVVISVLINGPGLGVNILRAVQVTNVGAALEAGLAIVVLAIVLDRVTEHASKRFDARSRALAEGEGDAEQVRSRRIRRRAVLGALAVVALGTLALGLSGGNRFAEFPAETVSLTFREPVNDAVGWIRTNLFFLTDTLKEGFTAGVLNPLEGILTTAPFWLVILVAAGIAFLVSGLRPAIVAAACLVGTIALQLWEHSMQTLATVLVATALTMIVGIALGIAAAVSAGFSRAVRPFLDAAQTLPAFVYLLPAIALFDPSRFTAVVASVIFAVPPVVRLVEAGIRSVPAVTVEAATAAGASRGQLLAKVQLPIARPALLLATNQGIVMVLGMVVLGGLVGAGALGYDVVAGFSQRNDFGMGLAAGVCMVLLGIALDRTSQGAGRRRTHALAPSSGGGSRVQVEENVAEAAAVEAKATA